MKSKSNFIYTVLPVLGMVFCLIYINRATLDVVYTDYIRLINSYLPDVWNPSKFFVPDLLTRIPINYLERGINVTFFGYSTTFDMTLGIFGLGASALIVGNYCRKMNVNAVWFAILMVLMFSLNKWEMLTNGSGWVHFAAFACFYYHYLVIDRALVQKKPFPKDNIRLITLPFIITLGVAGPYCAIYSLTLILTYGWLWLINGQWRDKIKSGANWKYIIYAACALIPLLIYMLSNSFAAGPVMPAKEPLLQYLLNEPLYFVKFFLASLGSMILGGEVAKDVYMSQAGNFHLAYLLGVSVLLLYFLALYLNLYFKIYKKTAFPLMLVISGGLNHLLILLSRWRFQNVIYAMSSRYALQFQVGILGIILTFAFIWKTHKSHIAKNVIIVISCGILIYGNVFTTYKEWNKAPARKDCAKRFVNIIMNYKTAADEELLELQYNYTDITKNSLRILEENKLNVFKK